MGLVHRVRSRRYFAGPPEVGKAPQEKLLGNNAQTWRAICVPTVPRFVEAHADPRQPVADRSARFPIIFSDAAGEDDQVDAIERSDHRSHLLAHGIAEHLNRKSCIGI
jgi:hypothetical protein